MIARRNAWPYLAIVVVATILMLALELPLSRLDVPYTFGGDALDKLAQIKTVTETGWLFHNDRLGYPFGYDRLDFPRFDSLNYALMAPVALLLGAGAAMNLYYLAGFYLIAFAAFWTFRRLGLDVAPAMLCALAYSFLPYHVLRGVHHLTNGTYYLVPLAMFVLIELALDRLDTRPGDGRRRWIFALVLAVLLPLQMPYNGVFFAYLCVVACAIALVRGARWRGVAIALSLLAATGLAFIAEQLPVTLHAIANGKPTLAAAREPFEAELYSMQLNQVLTPTQFDRRASMAQAADAFADAMRVPSVESRDQYIGALGVLGFAALLWALCRAVGARGPPGATTDGETEVAVRVAAALAIALVLLVISSGFGTLIAYWITAKIRAYNRALPFLAFACLFGAGWMLQLALRRIGRRWIGHAAIALIAIAALSDILVQPQLWARDDQVANYDAARAFFAGVEQRLGDGAAVFQLPAVWYPEHAPINAMQDYDEFKPFLLTRTLKFSYGVGRGRRGYGWNKYVDGLAPKEAIAQAHAMGFAAILVDGLGYDDDTRKTMTDALADALPKPPTVSGNLRWWLFPLDGCCGDTLAQIEHGTGPRTFAYTIGSAPIKFTAGGDGALYSSGGWHDPETWGVWSTGSHANVRMRLDPVPASALTLSIETRMFVSPKVPERKLAISANGHPVASAVYTTETANQLLRVEVPADAIDADGVLELVFTTTPQTSPRSAGVSEDGRLLGVALVSLSIAPADRAP